MAQKVNKVRHMFIIFSTEKEQKQTENNDQAVGIKTAERKQVIISCVILYHNCVITSVWLYIIIQQVM